MNDNGDLPKFAREIIDGKVISVKLGPKWPGGYPVYANQQDIGFISQESLKICLDATAFFELLEQK
jgi:hypothetical protein